MARLRQTPEGWYAGNPTDETIAWANKMEADGDAEKPNDMRNFSANRWRGFVAEKALNVWLEQNDVGGVTWNGWTDPLPDFVIDGVGVGVKCCGSRKPWHDNLVVNVYERHREHVDEEELFFVGYEEGARPRVLLLGGIPQEQFFDQASFVKAGEMINPTTVAENDVWNLRTRLLQRPERWLARMRVAEGSQD